MEVIHPHVPVLAGQARDRLPDRFVEVELNPQPIPPGIELRFAVQRTAHAIADATIAAQVAGHDAAEIVQELGDDWCPTPPDNKIP